MGRKRKTHEEFVNEMKEVNPNIEVLGQYLGANKKILCRCKIDGYVWEAIPCNLLYGAGCPKCSGNINKTHEEFMAEFKEKNKNSCTIEILSRYKNNKSNMKCRCKVCNNIWNSNPQSLLYGSNCPNCSYKENGRKRRKTHEDFVDEMKTINSNIKIIGKYRGNKEKLSCECKVCGNIWDVKPNSLLNGSGCPICAQKNVANKLRMSNEEFIKKLKELNPTYEVLDEYISCAIKVRCRCKICGGIWEAEPIKLLNYRGCPICAGKKCVQGINDIATKRPDLIKYFVNKEDATKYTTGSTQRLIFKCPDCGQEKEMVISVLTRSGFSCDICSDNISYPNKYMRGFLSQLPVENVDYEYSPEWIKPLRYDGYFEYNGHSYIMEMDGALGHGKNKYGSKEKDTEGLKKDKYKENIANQHNIKVIRIDCEVSESDYISNNIINSELADIFDLSNIDWNKCNEFATKNIVKEVCDYFNKTDLNPSIIAKDLKLGNNTVRRYLKRGTELGWCNYIPNGHRTKKVYIPKTDRRKNRGIYVYNKNDVNTILHVFQNSIECAENMSNIYDCIFIPSGIRNVINGYKKTYKGFVFKYAS